MTWESQIFRCIYIYIYITWKTLNIWKPNHNNLTWDLWKNSPGITQLHLTTWRCLKNWGYPKSAVSMEKTRFRNIGFMKWTGKKWKLVTSLLASPMGPLHPSPSPWSEYVLSLCPRQHSDLHLGGTFEVSGPNALFHYDFMLLHGFTPGNHFLLWSFQVSTSQSDRVK